MSEARRGSRLDSGYIKFEFDGQACDALSGDSAASALMAKGVRLFGRSIKYRRPRGVLTAGPEEPNALITLSSERGVIANVPAPQLRLKSGMRLHSQNRWPSLKCDLGTLLRIGANLFTAGFYYKTFIWPSWHAYEGLIRRLAGMGPAPIVSCWPAPAIEHLSCDVLVAGAGPAGLAAALAAAREGRRVIVCEREPQCGGELEFETAAIGNIPAKRWVEATLAEIQRHNGRVLTGSTVIYASGGLVIVHAEEADLSALSVYRIRARRMVNAMGSHERPIAFIDNDRPGIMLLGAAERYLVRYGVSPGKTVVLFGNHDRLYWAASRFLGSGVRVGAIVDSRPVTAMAGTHVLRQELSRSGVQCFLSSAVVSAGGRANIRTVRIAHLNSPDSLHTVACDALLVSGGWSGSVIGAANDGGTRVWMEDSASFIPKEQSEWRLTAGAAHGKFELGEALADGHGAGISAAHYGAPIHSAASERQANRKHPHGVGDGAPQLVAFWKSPSREKDEKWQFVDFQNDVTVADLRLSIAEGFRDIEHIKRYTTLGVGTDQGRVGGTLGAAIVAEITKETIASVGMSRPRPPFQPATLRTIAGFRVGEAFRPVRRTPVQELHVSQHAALEPSGPWIRPRFYGSNGDTPAEAAVVEARRVRATGGIMDASTLGKLEIIGPDAADFLDHLYLTKASTIKTGRGRYMVNLREDGMVLDDGIVLRLAPDRFLATTSSAHGLEMLSHFEFHRDTEWRDRRVGICDVTDAWAVIAVAGPRSRDTLLQLLGANLPELANLPHMAFASGRFRGADIRVLRASFSGELAYEVHCRPTVAIHLWGALGECKLEPYGLEALDILRVEKGYLVSSEMNGQTTPYDLGMHKLVDPSRSCVGQGLLHRAAFREPSRPRLVGLKAVNGEKFLAGAQLTTPDSSRTSCGHVTSAVFSPALNEWIGLALVARSEAAEGNILGAFDPLHGLDSKVRITPPVHFDPSGERMKS